MAFPDLEDWCFRTGLDSFLASCSLAASSLIFRAGANSFFRRLGLRVLATLFCGVILASSEVVLVDDVLSFTFSSSDSSASSDSDILGRFPVLLILYFARSLLNSCSFGVRFSASELSVSFDDGVFSRFFRILRPGRLDFSIDFVMRFTVGNGVTLTCVRFVARIRPGMLFGGFLPLANFGREVFCLLTFFNRILVFVPVEAGMISCLRIIIRQRFTIGLTFQDMLRCLYLHLFSTFLIVKIFGVKLFCSPRFERLAERMTTNSCRDSLCTF
jgi:hypothetical protein